MREALIQIWLKSYEKMSELLDKQVNVQKESLKRLPGFTQPPASQRKKCAMKMKERKKTTAE